MVGIDPLYFLDVMRPSEMVSIHKAMSEHDRTAWEQARLISFFSVVAQQGTKNIKSPKDIYHFPWDEDKKQSRQLTREESEKRLQQINSKR